MYLDLFTLYNIAVWLLSDDYIPWFFYLEERKKEWCIDPFITTGRRIISRAILQLQNAKPWIFYQCLKQNVKFLRFY